MITNDYPLVAVISMGHTGSRLLTTILNDNGIFMGRKTCVPGEDSKIGITNDRVFEQAALKYHLGLNKSELKELLKDRLSKYEKVTFDGSATTFEIKDRIKNIVFGKSTYFKNRPSNTWAYGIKTAISSTMFCDALFDLAVDLEKKDDIYIIHLTRNLGDWLNSGYAKGTKGIKRPIYLDYANNFLNDYNKYLWFDNVDQFIKVDDYEIDLRNYSLNEMEKDRIYLESELWGNSNMRVLKLKSRGAKYIQIKFDDLVLNPIKVTQELTSFFNKEIEINHKKLDVSRTQSVQRIINCSPNVLEIQKLLGY